MTLETWKTTSGRSKARRVALATGSLAALAIGVSALSSAAQAPPAITSEPLTSRAVFPDPVDVKFKIKLDGHESMVVKVDDPSRTATVRFTVPPGVKFPWHTHRGPVIVNIVSGELVYVPADGCERHSYSAGTAFVDPGHGHVHSAVNPSSSTPTVFVATFLEAPAAPAPLLIPAETPANCQI